MPPRVAGARPNYWRTLAVAAIVFLANDWVGVNARLARVEETARALERASDTLRDTLRRELERQCHCEFSNGAAK